MIPTSLSLSLLFSSLSLSLSLSLSVFNVFFEPQDLNEICFVFQLDTKDQALDELESRAYIHQTTISEKSENSHESGNQTLTQSEREAFEAMKQQVSYFSIMIPTQFNVHLVFVLCSLVVNRK
jgi:hypothetical protein